MVVVVNSASGLACLEALEYHVKRDRAEVPAVNANISALAVAKESAVAVAIKLYGATVGLVPDSEAVVAEYNVEAIDSDVPEIVY